ncbi:hypothetical protein [Pseudomonas amygdali]|uniref:hypothetical protein n=1 Tax=Pseudomonas amygdali TaxID=47877 RepID=UPI0006E57424|nr:hypothetical protein [Pseudomonas amygdali]KPY55629.1 hypothetical protein ALO93_200244 [Pseudomonas amygdali pv. sesami]
MSKVIHIDTSLPITFYGCAYEKIADPVIVSLAEQMKMPRLLCCSAPVTGAQIVVQETAGIIDWLRSSPRWSALIEESLQCLAEDSDGRPLLTAFMPIDELVMLAEELNKSGLCDLRSKFADWRKMGATEGSFDAYQLHSDVIKSATSAFGAAHPQGDLEGQSRL